MTLQSIWYKRRGIHPVAYFLFPFSLLFGIIVLIRKMCYRLGILKVVHFPVPVIVVGNITVGGTGKTPLVIHLANFLIKRGYRVGIVSRGYGVKKIHSPKFVDRHSNPSEVGDEALVMAHHLAVPIVVCADRVLACQTLIRDYDCNLILSDDGLQHYHMGRDIEIAVIDGQRLFGNGFLLPAGPLREPKSRLKQTHFVVYRIEDEPLPGQYPCTMRLEMDENPCSVSDFSTERPLEALLHQKIHAVAGIGCPDKFFYKLQSLRLNIERHAFPDHYRFRPQDIDFGPQELVVMTEKDAVKCCPFSDERDWFFRVHAVVDVSLEDGLIALLQTL